MDKTPKNVGNYLIFHKQKLILSYTRFVSLQLSTSCRVRLRLSVV